MKPSYLSKIVWTSAFAFGLVTLHPVLPVSAQSGSSGAGSSSGTSGTTGTTGTGSGLGTGGTT
ncbi:hypothetical protein AB0756_31750, partial [Tolypothrix campylonemoides VB511288_2]